MYFYFNLFYIFKNIKLSIKNYNFLIKIRVINNLTNLGNIYLDSKYMIKKRKKKVNNV